MAASQSSYVSGPFLSSATWLPSRSGASLTRPRIPSKRAPRDATYSGTARSSCRTSRSCDKMDPPRVFGLRSIGLGAADPPCVHTVDYREVLSVELLARDLRVQRHWRSPFRHLDLRRG